MRTLNWMVLALLVLTMTAVAEQSQPAAQTAPPAAPSQPVAQSAPVTMDQVVDRVIEREKDLIKMLAPRTPVVETYLQNLTQDPQLGPIPRDDRYFLGRMDLSETIDRTDYLKDKDEGWKSACSAASPRCSSSSTSRWASPG